ncbi:uncharacterized protein SPSC_01250 [Sporisorium scitamineum]|uniref:Uncharacterized protein n=3 Tax=Sporisorium scitamineum TaxID=49012 RepID=A0A127Z918_9BASI|nr:uncharacterized protein SPSC_01250 [Sporisorium scitamineum]
MTYKLLALFHVFGALVLCTSAAIHLLVHPLSAPSATITIILITLGGLLIVQELSTPSSRWHRFRAQLLNSFFNRALCFLLATAVTFDQLTDLPCDIQGGASPYSTPSAKFSVSAGDAARSVTTGQKLTKRKGPPVFGTAFYVCRSLAPHCIRIDAVPGQVAGSTAWVNMSVNGTSWVLVLSACAATLAVSAAYFVLALLHRSGRVRVSPSMRRKRDHLTDPLSLHNVGPSRCDVKQSPSTPYHVNLYTTRTPIDLYAEHLQHHSTSSTPSLHPRSTHTIESALPPTQGAASTPDQVFRIDKLDASPPTARAASDIARRKENEYLETRRDRYGYEDAYRTVDFSSGCIMHYPIFKKKQREKGVVEGFATLLPPDFSRVGGEVTGGLAPRIAGKGRASVASGTTQSGQRGNDRQEEGGARAVTTESAVQLSAGMHCSDTEPQNNPQTVVVETAPALLSPSDIDHEPWPKKKHKRTPKHSLRPVASLPTQRLGTAESAHLMLSTTSTVHHHSRPGTATSTKSATSFRLLRRRGLFATLDLHLGSRLSGISQDASLSVAGGGGGGRSSYDSQRSCSAGTFGDGVPGDGSPLSTPKGERGSSSPVPGEQSLVSASQTVTKQ